MKTNISNFVIDSILNSLTFEINLDQIITKTNLN